MFVAGFADATGPLAIVCYLQLHFLVDVSVCMAIWEIQLGVFPLCNKLQYILKHFKSNGWARARTRAQNLRLGRARARDRDNFRARGRVHPFDLKCLSIRFNFTAEKVPPLNPHVLNPLRNNPRLMLARNVETHTHINV